MFAIRIAACLALALTTLTACAVDSPSDSASATAPVPAAQWSCSPDAESRYHIGPDGMTLEVCSAGCARHAKGAVCGG